MTLGTLYGDQVLHDESGVRFPEHFFGSERATQSVWQRGGNASINRREAPPMAHLESDLNVLFRSRRGFASRGLTDRNRGVNGNDSDG